MVSTPTVAAALSGLASHRMVVGINSLVILLLAHHAQNPAVGGLGIALVFFAASGLGSFLATLLTPPTVRRWGWPTDRLRSIAHLGVRTRDDAFVVNELTPRPSRLQSSCAHPAATSGPGARPMRPNGLPAPPRTSASW